MRYFQKGAEPSALSEYKACANEDWKPLYEDLEKKPIREALIREQGYLCCYCGGRIGERSSDCHIEHFITQKERPDLALDYGNMLASCQGMDERARVPEHCGHARGTKPIKVSPLFPDCESFFTYSSNGKIEPSTDPARHEAAEETIRTLGLSVPKLQAARKAAIDGALEGLEEISAEEMRVEAASYEKPDPDGRLAPFCFAIHYMLLKYA
jgi:uncharacterized protein (TIGR02646 family)